MNSQPLVSIILPSYNRAHKLKTPIESIIRQQYAHWELLIIDDRSTDQTKELVEAYIARDVRIKYLVSERKKGPAGARNMGLAHAQGEYIAFLDSDDEWMPQHLGDSIEILERNEVEVCFALWRENHAGELMNVDGSATSKLKFEKAYQDSAEKIEGNAVFFKENFLEYAVLESLNCYMITTMVFAHTILKTIGNFNERLLRSEDTEFIFRVLSKYKFCLLKDYHVIYNYGDDNIYAFINRNKIDVDRLICDQASIHKFNLNGESQNKVRRTLLKIVKCTEHFHNKEACKQVIKADIASKYFTLGFINRKVNRLKALEYYIKAFLYEADYTHLLFIIALFHPAYYPKIEDKLPVLNFW